MTGQETDGVDGSVDSSDNSDRPNGISSVAGLTSANVPTSWNEAASRTLGAWNLGTATQAPVLRYADYDGATMGTAPSYTGGYRFHCARDAANAPAGATLVSNCGTLLPGVVAANVLDTTADISIISSTTGTAYVAVLTDGATAPTATAIKAAGAGSGGVAAAGNMEVTASARVSLNLTGLEEVTKYDAYIVVESDAGIFGRVMKADVDTLRVADADGNGLIEIGTLAELNNVRYNLAGTDYRASSGAIFSTLGCPADGCRGYELTADLDFDSDGDGGTWVRNSDGSFTLDTDDNNDDYFVIASDGSSGGWVPIGDCGVDRSCEDDSFSTADETADNAPFTAVFDGAGHTISGLAISRHTVTIGLFGFIGEGADIRNLGLVDNLAKYTGTSYASVGGLVGSSDGSITASYATGRAEGSDGDRDKVGGLVGSSSGSITASYATGRVEGGDGDRDAVGGLVGLMDSGSITITASYTTGEVGGGNGDNDKVGGLVGWQYGGSITASYSIGGADGGGGNSDDVGGLVGQTNGGAIIASYATGDTDGGDGNSDYVGALVGYQQGRDAITASWGFGSTTGEIVGSDGSIGRDGNSDRPSGVTSATGLASINVPSSWNTVASRTLGAWDFGTAAQLPALNYADYDGETMGTVPITAAYLFHCASDAVNTPIGAILVPNCGTLLPSVVADVLTTTADIHVVSTTTGTAYIAALADGAAPPTAAAIKAAQAGSGGVIAIGSATVTAGARASVSLTDLMENTMHDAYIVIESSAGILGRVIKIDVDTMAIVSAANVLPTTADINVISDIAGIAYVAVLADGSAVPAAADIKDARAGSGGVVAVGSVATTASVRATVNLTGLTADTSYDTYIVVESGGVFGTVMKVDVDTLRLADADGNGLIEIGTLAELNNVRHNLAGTSYLVGPGPTFSTLGCPAEGCRGYELTADLDFDADGDGSTWIQGSDGSFTLDTDDNNDDYFVIASDGSSGGWVPIGGDYFSPFNAVFDGAGHSISGLAILRDLAYIGLFGATGSGADIRNLSLVGNLAKQVGPPSSFPRTYIGGLVGWQTGGSITASRVTGRVEGGSGDESHVGGLVGSSDGSITASYATGCAEGSDGNRDRVGGLVGSSRDSIVASYAICDINGSAGDADFVGGLVGWQASGSIVASYATGAVDGGDGNYDNVGGLVGTSYDTSTIIASYATGDADGGEGDADHVGALVGFRSSGPITASWGFGSATGETAGVAGSVDDNGDSDRPNGVSSATGLTSANVPASWNEAASSTLGAWNFGTTSQPPALNYADYDGSGTSFHCASDADNAPDDAIIIPDCGTLIPGQRVQLAPAPISGSLVRTGIMRDALVMGSTWINGVVISGDYLNFLMAGGDSAGGGNVDDDSADAAVGTGVSLYVAGTGMTLASYAPNFCANKSLKGGQRWAHFDVRALVGTAVDMEIHDRGNTDTGIDIGIGIGNGAINDCGFITFDHFYQSDSFQGTSAGIVEQPDSR